MSRVFRAPHNVVKVDGEQQRFIDLSPGVVVGNHASRHRHRDAAYVAMVHRITDERIPKSIPLGSRNLQDAEIDRDHMVRREDPNWGEEAEAQLANDGTFHYVNAAAQHSRLN